MVKYTQMLKYVNTKKNKYISFTSAISGRGLISSKIADKEIFGYGRNFLITVRSGIGFCYARKKFDARNVHIKHSASLTFSVNHIRLTWHCPFRLSADGCVELYNSFSM